MLPIRGLGPPSIFPQVMMSAVEDYKKLAADYSSITDEVVKVSYKVVLDKKISDLEEMLATYNSRALAGIQALKVN